MKYQEFLMSDPVRFIVKKYELLNIIADIHSLKLDFFDINQLSIDDIQMLAANDLYVHFLDDNWIEIF